MARTGIVTGGVATFTADVDIAQYQRVALSAAQTAQPANVEVAGAGDGHIGYADRPVKAGETVPVRLRNAEGTRLVIANTSFAQGVAVYGAANGEVDDTVSGNSIGVSLEAATAAGDIVSILDNNA